MSLQSRAAEVAHSQTHSRSAPTIISAHGTAARCVVARLAQLAMSLYSSGQRAAHHYTMAGARANSRHAWLPAHGKTQRSKHSRYFRRSVGGSTIKHSKSCLRTTRCKPSRPTACCISTTDDKRGTCIVLARMSPSKMIRKPMWHTLIGRARTHRFLIQKHPQKMAICVRRTLIGHMHTRRFGTTSADASYGVDIGTYLCSIGTIRTIHMAKATPPLGTSIVWIHALQSARWRDSMAVTTMVMLMDPPPSMAAACLSTYSTRASGSRMRTLVGGPRRGFRRAVPLGPRRNVQATVGCGPSVGRSPMLSTPRSEASARTTGRTALGL